MFAVTFHILLTTVHHFLMHQLIIKTVVANNNMKYVRGKIVDHGNYSSINYCYVIGSVSN